MDEDQKAIAEFWQIVTGYQRANVLFTFVELNLSSVLAEKKSLSAAEIAEMIKVHLLAAERFLNSCVVVGLLQRDEQQNYRLTALSETYLNKKSDSFLGGIVARHQNRSFDVWAKLTDKLQAWEYGEQDEATEPADEDQGAEAMAEQHQLALKTGTKLAESFDFSKYQKILDLGGGTGAMSIALCRKYPYLQSIVFDLADNIKVAEEFIQRENLDSRIKTVSGDFKQDELPPEFDLVLLANFMAVAEAEENQKLLSRIYETLPAGGVCVISGWIIDDSHLSPPESVLFCLEDICWNAPDVERSEKTYSEWLEKARFKNIRSEMYFYPTKFLAGEKV